MINKEITLSGFLNAVSTTFPLRRLILIISIIFAVALYNIIINNIAPTENILSSFGKNKSYYRFYSGSEGGFYIKIGDKLDKYFEDNSRFTIRNEMTDGGLDNVIKVVADGNAFGLVQESTLSSGDMLRDHIKFISPLYMERFHIVYKKESAVDYVFGNGVPTLKKTNPQDLSDLARFLKNSRISIGPVGSGSRTASTYLLDVLGITPKEILGLSQEKGIESLQQKGGIDIYMNIVGAPTENIDQLLKNKEEFGLISINPPIITEINKTFNTNYRLTDFKNKYETGKPVSTLGSYAYLIANKNIPESSITKILVGLDNIKKGIKDNFKEIDFTNENRVFQLDEIDFASDLKKNILRKKLEKLRAILIFIISIFLNTSLSIVFLVWTFSSLKLAKYYKKITAIYQSSFPKNSDLNNVDYSIPYIEIRKNRAIRTSTLINGITDTYNILTEVRQDYDTGGITDGHFENIKTNLKQSLSDFRKAIFRNIYLHLKGNENDIDEKLLDSYFAESFLTYEDYNILSAALTKSK